MSTDTIAVFAIAGSRDTAWLIDRLRELPSLGHVIDRWGAKWRVTDWAVDKDQIAGPGGFALQLYGAAASCYHMLPWGRFCACDEDREPVRTAFLAIAELLGKRRAIYHHELLPDGLEPGASIDDVEAALRRDWGAPSPSFEQLAAIEDWTPGCWFIDEE